MGVGSCWTHLCLVITKYLTYFPSILIQLPYIGHLGKNKGEVKALAWNLGNSIVVHSQLNHKRFPMDGGVVATRSHNSDKD